MNSSRARSYGLLVGAVLLVALAARLVPLYWSPLPATLDGFRYARLAATTVERAGLPLGTVQADEFVFTLNLVATSLVTGGRPLTTAQPFVAVAGAATPVIAVAFIRRIGSERDWPSRQVRIAAAAGAIALALEGLYLRRTGVPDEEALGLLVVPLLAVAVHRALATRRLAWGAVALVFIGVLPPLHNMSSLVGVLTVSAIAILHGVRAQSLSVAGVGLSLGVGFWGYFFGYFELAERLGIELTYSGLLRPHLGLFIAWVVVLLTGVIWFRATTTRAQRVTFMAPIALGFAAVVVNAVVPIFPGTVTSPLSVMAMVLVFVVPVLYAGWAVPVTTQGTGLPVLALLAAPVILTYYVLSTSLTPQFFDAVVRIQSFAHPPVMVLAALTAVGLGVASRTRTEQSWRVGRGILLGIFVVCVVVTVPLGYVNLDTGTYPSTTFESEFESAGFATEYVQGQYTTDHTLSRVGLHYFGATGGKAGYRPTREWLRGGLLPRCPVLAQESWTTTGAHLYPAQPETTTPARFEELQTRHHRVYDAGGHDPIAIFAPVNMTTTGC